MVLEKTIDLKLLHEYDQFILNEEKEKQINNLSEKWKNKGIIELRNMYEKNIKAYKNCYRQSFDVIPYTDEEKAKIEKDKIIDEEFAEILDEDDKEEIKKELIGKIVFISIKKLNCERENISTHRIPPPKPSKLPSIAPKNNSNKVKPLPSIGQKTTRRKESVFPSTPPSTPPPSTRVFHKTTSKSPSPMPEETYKKIKPIKLPLRTRIKNRLINIGNFFTRKNKSVLPSKRDLARVSPFEAESSSTVGGRRKRQTQKRGKKARKSMKRKRIMK
jgi:hypothetical protein